MTNQSEPWKRVGTLPLSGGGALPWERNRLLPWERRGAASALLPLRASLASMLTPGLFQQAWARVRRHPSPGLDGVTVSLFSRHLEHNLFVLRRRVLSRKYCPRPLLRICTPKKHGGVRLLGIPGLSDRIVQATLHMAVTPLIDHHFQSHVHGYRPGRSPATAIRHLLSSCGTRPWLEVVKADVEGLFDNLAHPYLLRAIDAVWSDPLWRWLQRRWLMAWTHPSTPGRGVPQGAPLSPLLANLYMHPLVDLPIRNALNAMEPARTLGMVAAVRYGDDFLLVSQRKNGGLQILRWLDGLLGEGALRLAPNKTSFTCNPAFASLRVLGTSIRFRSVKEGWRLEVCTDPAFRDPLLPKHPLRRWLDWMLDGHAP